MDLTLVIMAAGMGSRFGGLKQVEPVGPNGEIMADYSVHDAIKAGFTKVVFIIRKEHLDYFKNNIIPAYQDKIEVAFCFQELDNQIPNDVTIPKEREKMLGTGHAVLCAKDEVKGSFAVINADDFYGYNGLKCVADFLKSSQDDNEYLSVNYPYIATSSKNGKVKRGVCVIKDGYIQNNIEAEIGEENGKIIARSLNDNKTFEISEDQPVSMNLFGFKQSFFNYLQKEFDKFIHSDIGLTGEFFLSELLIRGIQEGVIKVKNEITNSIWMGVTYREDLLEVKNKIIELIQNGEYPNNLWG